MDDKAVVDVDEELEFFLVVVTLNLHPLQLFAQFTVALELCTASYPFVVHCLGQEKHKSIIIFWLWRLWFFIFSHFRMTEYINIVPEGTLSVRVSVRLCVSVCVCLWKL